MELYLQFGYGMMEHSRHLVSEWGGGTVVLSPRDLVSEQLLRLGETINGLTSGHVLLDPQFYLPHSDHERLCSHAFWPDDYETNVFFQGPALAELLGRLHQLNRQLRTVEFILPGLLAATVDDDWLETQRAILDEATSVVDDIPLFVTIALSADAARDQNQIATLVEWAERHTPAGYYIVCEHPGGDYLVDDANWLANVIDLAAGLRLRGGRVILGYCNHQMLVAAAAKVDAICSGTWMNVRAFPPAKFNTAYEEEIKQRATWYYCPQAMSEYKLPFLDIAQRQGLLGRMAPAPAFDGGYVDAVFSGAQPSTVGFAEQSAFRHYLHALRVQTQSAGQVSFDATIAAHEVMLDAAEGVLSQLARGGIRGQKRDFRDIIDVNRAALALLNATRGPLLRRQWTSLGPAT